MRRCRGEQGEPLRDARRARREARMACGARQGAMHESSISDICLRDAREIGQMCNRGRDDRSARAYEHARIHGVHHVRGPLTESRRHVKITQKMSEIRQKP